MNKKFRNEVQALFEKSKDKAPVSISEADLGALPEPVQRYLRYAQVLDKESIRTVRLKQEGTFKTKPEQSWMPMVAEQYFTTDPPAFLWYGTITPFPFMTISARDLYANGHGYMLVKLLSLFTLGNESGPNIDQGGAVRYLAEIAWFPTAWLSDYIQWEAIDSQSAKVTISHEKIISSAVLNFDELGRITDLKAERYYGEQMQHWSGKIEEYQEIGGILIPTKVEVTWNLPDGDFSYFRSEITEIEFNCTTTF